MIRNLLTPLLLLLVTASFSKAIEVGEPMKDMGTMRDLDSGLKLQLFVHENKLQACFIDAEGLVAESPAESILFIVDEPGHKADKWRSVLVPGDDACLVAPRLLYAPYYYKTRVIVRYKDGTTESMANFRVSLDRAVAESLEDN